MPSYTLKEVYSAMMGFLIEEMSDNTAGIHRGFGTVWVELHLQKVGFE